MRPSDDTYNKTKIVTITFAVALLVIACYRPPAKEIDVQTANYMVALAKIIEEGLPVKNALVAEANRDGEQYKRSVKEDPTVARAGFADSIDRRVEKLKPFTFRMEQLVTP